MCFEIQYLSKHNQYIWWHPDDHQELPVLAQRCVWLCLDWLLTFFKNVCVCVCEGIFVQMSAASQGIHLSSQHTHTHALLKGLTNVLCQKTILLHTAMHATPPAHYSRPLHLHPKLRWWHGHWVYWPSMEPCPNREMGCVAVPAIPPAL